MTTNTPMEVSEELKQLVIARLDMIPNHVRVSVGSEGDFTRAELIARVQSEDSVGREVMRSQLEFLRAMSGGRLLDEVNTNDA
ncbi:MAG: hypothetical protein V1489_01285 [Candidatus Liptonbacteria bacterium]